MPEISIAAEDNSGSFSAYASFPKQGKGSGIVVIQEIFGVNKFLRDLCDHYAELGYVAVCPDLFWRLEPGLQLDAEKEEDHKKAFSLYGKFNVAKGVDDLIAALRWVREHDSCTGKVGTVGYCLGGKLAYLMATRSSADASVGYYGVGIQDLLEEASAITHPLLLHVAEEDKFTPPDVQAKLRDGLGKIAHVSVDFYAGADHAFARIGGSHYDEKSARLANSRTEEFLAQNLK